MEKLERLNWPEATAFCVAAVCVVSGAVAVFSPWPWGGDSPWEALSALGTIAAAVAAVWLGTVEIRSRKQVEARERHVVTAVVRVELSNTLDALRLVMPILDKLGGEIVSGAIFIRDADKLAISAKRISVSSVERVLDKLGYLEADLGPRVAGLWATLPDLRADAAALGDMLVALDSFANGMIPYPSRVPLMANPIVHRARAISAEVESILAELD
jgi:hypothetical protein